MYSVRTESRPQARRELFAAVERDYLLSSGKIDTGERGVLTDYRDVHSPGLNRSP